MKTIFLGEVVCQRRQELGLTQEEVCRGICTSMTLSRFENGRQTPACNRIKAILYRLGIPDDRFYGLLNVKELEIETLEKEIIRCGVHFNRAVAVDKPKIREEALEYHRRLEAVMDKDDTLSRQLILQSRYVLGTESGPYSPEQELSLVLEALRLTSPKFDVEQIGQGLYTKNEIRLINNIANCYIRVEKHYDAIDILRQLLRYIQTHLQNLHPSKTSLTMVAFNYARELAIIKTYDKSIEIAEYGKKICLESGNYQFLPNLLASMAESYYYSENHSKSAELYRQAFYLYKGLENHNNLAIVQKEAKEHLGLVLE